MCFEGCASDEPRGVQAAPAHRLQETVSQKLEEPGRIANAPESAASAPLPEHMPPVRATSAASTGSPIRMSSLSKGGGQAHPRCFLGILPCIDLLQPPLYPGQAGQIR